MAVRLLTIAIVLAIAAGPARAQPGLTGEAGPASSGASSTPSEVLRQGNQAATTGDWKRVGTLVDGLLQQQLPPADLAEAHRLAGLAAFFQSDRATAEIHFLAYLRIDLDGVLDSTLYPPDVINFFNDVKAKHNAELRARRKKPNRHWALNLVPPLGQFQNGDRTKGWIIAGLLAGFAIGNGTTFFLLRSWCNQQDKTCDATKDRADLATQLRGINLATGAGLIVTYAYGVWDGVHGYRRKTREQAIQPFVTASSTERFVGVAGSF
jgi:hypothetical protein